MLQSVFLTKYAERKTLSSVKNLELTNVGKVLISSPYIKFHQLYKREKYLFGEGVSTIFLNNNEGVPMYRGLWAYL